MSIQAKKEGIVRLAGTVILLIGLFPAILFDYYIVNSIIAFYLDVIVTFCWFGVIICFKLEIEQVIDNITQIIMPLCILSLILITFGATLSINVLTPVSFIFLVISNVFLVLCWQFSLSIYKKEKLVYIITGLGYIVITLIFRMSTLLYNPCCGGGLLPLIIIIIGFTLIILAEYSMKRKGLLNYI